MKHILALIVGIAALLFTAPAYAQGTESVSLTTTAITAGATSNILATIDTRKQETVAVALAFNCSTATNVVPLSIVFDKSVDGSNWSDKDTFTWSYIRDGTTNTIYATTNITTGGYPYIRLKTIANPGSSGAINLESFKYFVKFMTSR